MLFAGVGICLVMITLFWGISIYQFTRRAAVVQGVVTKLNYGGSHPEIKFIARGGKEIEFPQGG